MPTPAAVSTNRLALLALVPALALAACGVADGDFEDLDEGNDVDGEKADALSSPGTWYAVRRDTRRCAAPACGGFFVSTVGRATMKCPATGTAAAECYLPELDLSASGLDGIEAGNTRTIQTLVRGRLGRVTRNGQRLDTIRVTEVWTAPKAVSLKDRDVWHVRSTDTRKQATRIGSSSRRVLDGVDLRSIRITEQQRADAFGATNTSEGAVVVGTIETTGSGSRTNNVLVGKGVFLRVKPVVAPATGRVCDGALQAELSRVTDGLVYLSESDYPFEYFATSSAGGDAIDETAFRRIAGLPTSAAVETRSLADVLAPMERVEEWMDAETAARAARYTTLRQTIETQLQDVRVFRTGEIEVKVWILGTTACGDVAGLTSISIET